MNISSFDDFYIGYKGTFTKKVTEQDNDSFAELSGDYNPLHFRDDVAREHNFIGKVSNGMVTESRVAAALVHTFGSEKTLVLALQKNTKFLRPVYMGDDITATVEVAEILKSQQALKIKAECHNQNNEKVVAIAMLIKILPRK